MTNPISNQQFSYDSVKYVYQDNLDTRGAPPLPPTKPFKISAPNKSEKSKKDIEKKKKQGDKSGPFGMI
ncbi:MAG: hypothetical protein WCF65_03830 [Parachlamydiaceae bacterium]